ncbi:MAG TPA: hypothetical protein PKD49_15075 [Hyphomicrobium sp.]|nr:hypothetical protein [Hyphomicrobium sp.]
MVHSILDYLTQVIDISVFVAAVTACLMGFAYWLVRLMTDSLLLSMLYTPAMLFGGLASNHFFQQHFIVLMQDTDSNTVLGVALGIILAMLTMLMVTRVVYAIGEMRRQAKRTATP